MGGSEGESEASEGTARVWRGLTYDFDESTRYEV